MGARPKRARAVPALAALPAILVTLALPIPLASRTAAATLADPGASVAIRVASEVDSSRIVETIRRLSQDLNGAPVSRYAKRPETHVLYAAMVRDSLNSFLVSPDTATVDTFYSERLDTRQENVIGIRRAQTPTSAGLVLLTAHLDATGTRTDDWDGLTDPAPGADDNASGLACVLEGARLLTCANPPCGPGTRSVIAPPEFPLPFDLGFVAFGAEESLGPSDVRPLEGSRVFARALEDSGIPLLAVFNCDMIAFNPDREKIDIDANPASEWIADLIVETAATVAPNLRVNRVLHETTRNSDHASFWNVGEDAVTAIENEFPSDSTDLYPGNPHYHTTHDTLGTLNIAMATDVTRVVLASIARLAVPPAGDPDLFVDAPHFVVVRPRNIFVGDEVTVRVRVFNRGGAMPEGSGTAEVSLVSRSFDPKAGSRPIGRKTIELPIVPWFYKSVEFTWRPGDEDAGVRTLLVSVMPSSLTESSAENNFAERRVTVFRNAITNLRLVPNPARQSRVSDDLVFKFDSPVRVGSQDIEAVVFDAAGREVARHDRVPAEDGINRILSWVNFKAEGGKPLPSGMYVVEVRLLDSASGAVVSRTTGKFTLLR